MDIARLLNRDDYSDDSDQSDHVDSPPTPQQRTATPAAPPERSLTPVLPPQRAVARARPKRARKPSIASLRAQVEAFQCVADHLPYVLRDLDDVLSITSTPNSTDSEEEDQAIAGDEDAQRMRSFLKRTVLLSRQAQEEIAIRTEYLRLLKRHYEGTANLQKLMRGLRLDSWFWMCERWRTLARQHYKPLSKSKCYAIMQETLQAIKNYKLPDGTKQTDAFGWRDSVLLDADQHYVRFITRKTLHADMEQIVDHAWSLYSDGDLFKKAHLGENCEFFLQVLQWISPDVFIIQRVEKYPDLVQLTHSLALCFRVRTETGYLFSFRCIESPRLQMLMKADGLSVAGTFFWDTFDFAHRDGEGDCDEIKFTMAGSIGSDQPTYAKRWRDEIVVSLVRYEIEFMDKPILSIESIESSTQEDTNISTISDSQAIQ